MSTQQSLIGNTEGDGFLFAGIQEAFNSEIGFRLETDFCEGFCFVIVDPSKFPRFWIDQDIDKKSRTYAESDDYIIYRTNPFLEKDWISRIYGSTFREACINFFDEIYRLYPKSKFTEWYANTFTSRNQC